MIRYPFLQSHAELLIIHQILAWNGGGSSNVSEIFGDTSRQDSPKKVAAKTKEFLKAELENLEQFFDELK